MTKVSQLRASTTTSGTANAASLTLGSYRDDVDILVNGNGSNWTVTVEVKDANDDWIYFDMFVRDGSDDDTLQLETAAEEVRAYFDQDVQRLTVYSKGGE